MGRSAWVVVRGGTVGAAVLVSACGLIGGGGGGGTEEAAPAPVAAPTAAPAPAAAAPRAPGPVQPFSPADPSPTAAPAGPSLFQRLGGEGAIRAVVDTFHARTMADSRISAFFRGVDDAQFKRLLVELICQTTGGPCRYSGRSMREVHRGMNLTDAHFDALVSDLVAALDAFQVPEREKNELLTALGGLRGQIVGQ